MQKLGLFGGTFDPIHKGHLHIARAFANELQLDQVIFLPAGDPYHKNAPRTAAHHRFAMIERAIADEERFVVSDCDMVRQGATYTFDTIQIFRQQFPATQFYWLLGMDSLLTLHTWKRWQNLVQQTHMVVAARSNEHLAQAPRELHSWLNQALHDGSLHILHAPLNPISSSDIRAQLYQQRPVNDLLCPAVWDYIQQHHLYHPSKA